MSAKPELPSDQSCPHLTHTDTSRLLGKHTGLSNKFYPTLFIQFGQWRQTLAFSGLTPHITDRQGYSHG